MKIALEIDILTNENITLCFLQIASFSIDCARSGTYTYLADSTRVFQRRNSITRALKMVALGEARVWLGHIMRVSRLTEPGVRHQNPGSKPPDCGEKGLHYMPRAARVTEPVAC